MLSDKGRLEMKKISVFIVAVLSALIFMACNKGSDVEPDIDTGIANHVPPIISAEVEILEINGHELTLEVIKSGTKYCKAGDILKGELKRFDYYYNKKPFKVGDIMTVQSDYDSVTDSEIKFDRIRP
jgi:hypothetical protein